jgi:hypothetical protein
VKQFPTVTKHNLAYYEAGCKHRAWTLITDEKDRPFRTFKTFCEHRQPWGLGVNHREFMAHLKAELGDREAELLTVAPGDDLGGRPRKEDETGDTVSPVSEAEERKGRRLRAILRAPEPVQDLYRRGLVSQTTAAKLGPKKPTPEQAARIADARTGRPHRRGSAGDRAAADRGEAGGLPPERGPADPRADGGAAPDEAGAHPPPGRHAEPRGVSCSS